MHFAKHRHSRVNPLALQMSHSCQLAKQSTETPKLLKGHRKRTVGGIWVAARKPPQQHLACWRQPEVHIGQESGETSSLDIGPGQGPVSVHAGVTAVAAPSESSKATLWCGLDTSISWCTAGTMPRPGRSAGNISTDAFWKGKDWQYGMKEEAVTSAKMMCAFLLLRR